MPLFPAVKFMDTVIGVDIHALAPIPGIPIHAYVGPVYLWSTPVFPSNTVFINGMPACSVGALGYFFHVPQGVPVPPTPTNTSYWKRYYTNVPMVLTLTGLTVLANLAIAGISTLLPKNKTVERFIKDVTGIDTSTRQSTWETIKGTFQAYTQWQTWVKLLMPPLPYPGAQGSVAVGSPNVTVNGGPLAFVGPLLGTSCSDIPVVPNAVTLGFSNVLVGVSFADLVEGIAAQAARAGIQHGLGKGIHSGSEGEPEGAPEQEPPAEQQNSDCGRPGEPIDPVTGASESEYVDYQFPAVFRWERCDSSAWCSEDGPLGYGVRHSYQHLLELSDKRVVYIDHRRRRFAFGRDKRGAWRGMLGYALRDEGNGRFVVSHGDNGSLGFIRDPSGNGEARLAAWLRDGVRDILAHDADGRLAGIRQSWREDGKAAQAEYLLHYDDAGHIVAVTCRREAGEATVLQYAYDAAGRMTAVRNASGATRMFGHDAENRIVRRSDANGYCFHYKYDETGRCIESAGDDGLWRVRLRYVPGQTLVTQTDNGLWVYAYDAAGTITKVLDPYGGTTERITGPDGRVLREIDAGGRVTQWLYDAAGRNTGRRDRWGNALPPKDAAPALPNPLAWRLPGTASSWEWGDVDDAPSALRLPHFVTTLLPAPTRQPPTKERDVLGRVVARRDALGRVGHTAYTDTGRIACETDADGREHRREYASWNLCVARIDPRGAATRFRYTRREKIAAVIDANGNESKYIYDCKDRLIQVARHGVLREVYRYDVGDRLIAKEDGEGQTLLRIEIGPNGLQSKRELASGDVHTYAYDQFGNITEASTSKAKVEIPHAGDRRMADRRDGRGVAHQWRNGCLATTTYFDRFTITYEALAAGDVLMHLPVGPPQRIQRAADGSILRNLPSGTNELSRFDALGRCTGRLAWHAGATEPAWHVRYEYSGAGELLAVHHSRLGTIINRYDAAHALVEQAREGAVLRYAYDPAGNLLATPAHPQLRVAEGNRLTESGDAQKFIYNARNHLAEIAHANGRRTAFEYDCADMLVRITGGEGCAVWEAEYDAIGRRTAKVIDGVRTEFFWDMHRLAAEQAADGALRLYVYANDSALVPLGFIDYASVEADSITGRAYFVFHDQVGMPELIESSRGDVVWRARIVEPYGTVMVAPGSSITYSPRFPGHYYDAEIGLFCNRFRYYSPTLARYLQSDPIGQSGGVNLYAYPANPLVAVDLLGLHPPVENEPPSSPEKPPVPQQEEPAEPSPTPPEEPTTQPVSSPAGHLDAPASPADIASVPPGSYDQPNGGRTDIGQAEDHGAGVNHTHDPIINTNPKTGQSFVNGLQRGADARPVSNQDIQNIKSGAATPSQPKGR